MSTIQENRGLFPGAYNAGNDYREDDGKVREVEERRKDKRDRNQKSEAGK